MFVFALTVDYAGGRGDGNGRIGEGGGRRREVGGVEGEGEEGEGALVRVGHVV